MIKKMALALCCAVVTNVYSSETIWNIGELDGRADEFALAPDRFKEFLSRDFGYEDKYFVVGQSSIKKDFPYILPGPVDTWGGTWPTSGWRTHEVNLLFDVADKPESGDYKLVVNLADFAKEFLPLVKVSINNFDYKVQLSSPGYDVSSQRKPTQMEKVQEDGALYGNYDKATPYSIEIPVKSSHLKKGGNNIMITVLEGSWVLFDNIRLEGPENTRLSSVKDVFIRDVYPADYELLQENQLVQPLIVDLEHLAGTPLLEVELDGKVILKKSIEKGRYQLEVPMPSVNENVSSKYRILLNGQEILIGTVERAPQKKQELSDYVDTRIGTAHSRWMIAPGPWMPFSMVKMSPDNQNMGWQAGYQPSFENIGCFSHIHEWTLGGLGIMPTNGTLKVRVGDEQKPDDGYRSRIDKRSEKAGIGLYSVDLLDYKIKAEITATTRCGFERFTFPVDRKDNRILVELHPQTEYDFSLHNISVKKVNNYRIEGMCRQYSPKVWSDDAEQDYTLNFVLEFDQPILGMGIWKNDEIMYSSDELVADSCKEAGLFLSFDTKKNPVVQVRSGISLVSVKNASENLQKEIIEPFGWDFDAVVQYQKDTWNELFGRVIIKTNDRLEKARFYNNMYRSICSRNIWSDVNGEWMSTDGK